MLLAAGCRERAESERFCAFACYDLTRRDKVSLDLFWLRHESLEGADALPEDLGQGSGSEE